MSKTDDILRLHTDSEGIVWCGQSGVQAYCSGTTPEEFVLSQAYQDAQHVRVLGVSANARLICSIYDKKFKQLNKKQVVQLGSPACCFHKSHLDSPQFVLQQMWQPATAVTSRWYGITNYDYTNYMSIAALQEYNQVGTKLRQLIRYHPAWVALTFPATCSIEYGCRLACEIVDPRWYNQHGRPERTNCLMVHLGLTPENFRLLSKTNPPHGSALSNAATVLHAWAGNRIETKVDLADPRNYLWRICHAHREQNYRGLLKASRAFVRLVRWTWLQEIAQAGQPVFEPGRYFKHQSESVAYAEHLLQIKTK